MSNININNQQTQATGEVPAPDEALEAFEKTAVERAAIEPSDFASLTVDIGQAVDIVLAAIPRIRSLQKEIDASVSTPVVISELETLTLATAHAHALLKISMSPPEELDAVYKEASERRTVLKLEASGLAGHGLLNRDTVAGLKSENGFRNVAYELMSLVALFREAQSRIAGRTATTPADLDRAAVLATKLLKLAALRDSRRSLTLAALEERLRAFTLMHRAYEQARRAVEYVRWEQGDADKIAPSIYGNKGGRRKGVEPDEDPTVVPIDASTTTPVAPAPVDAPKDPVTPAPVTGSAVPIGHRAPGVQGGSPFEE